MPCRRTLAGYARPVLGTHPGTTQGGSCPCRLPGLAGTALHTRFARALLSRLGPGILSPATPAGSFGPRGARLWVLALRGALRALAQGPRRSPAIPPAVGRCGRLRAPGPPKAGLRPGASQCFGRCSGSAYGLQARRTSQSRAGHPEKPTRVNLQRAAGPLRARCPGSEGGPTKLHSNSCGF